MSEQTGAGNSFDPHNDAQHWEVLPVISLAGWFSDDPDQRQEVVENLIRGATGSGFFYITDHGIKQSLIDAVYEASKAFHDQPQGIKELYSITRSLHHRGYVSIADNGTYEKAGATFHNHHETFDLSFDIAADDPRAHKGFGMVGPNIWPDLEGFKEVVSAYYAAVYQLGRQLTSAFELGLGLEPGALLQNFTVPTSQLRLMKYPENDAPMDIANHGIGAHSDFECFTMLHTRGPGLQVLSADDHWVEAPPMENGFIVNIGDCLEAWTAGLFKSTQHRVVNLGNLRYSLPFFFATDFDVDIEPLPAFSTPQTRLQYPTFKAGEHLWARTIDAFPYLTRKHKSGELAVDFIVADENPFKRLSLEEAALKRS
jgi:isopenicillin N synthase-like dioxygenase